MYSLRKVTENDSKLLFEWANDPDVRANSKNSKIIIWSEHVVWLAEKLSDRNVYMYILSDSRQNIGVVRFEQLELEFVASYSIDARYRGRGFGKLILKMGIDNICNIFKNAIFIGYVREGNIPSEKIFNNLNFIFIKQEVINNNKFNVYKKYE